MVSVGVRMCVCVWVCVRRECLHTLSSMHREFLFCVCLPRPLVFNPHSSSHSSVVFKVQNVDSVPAANVDPKLRTRLVSAHMTSTNGKNTDGRPNMFYTQGLARCWGGD